MNVKFLAPLMLFAGAAHAQAQNYEDWRVTVVDSDTVLSITTNDSGAELFNICYVSSQNCLWGFAMNDVCNDGDKYQVLVNASSGATAMDVHCQGAKNIGQIILLGDFDRMQSFSENDDRIGIAVAMAGGNFKVLRFSLRGSAAATQAAASLVLSAGKSSTKDLTL